MSEVAQSCPALCNPWTVAYQAPLSMGFFRQEYWSGLPFPSPEDLPDLGIELASPALAGKFYTTESPRKWSRKWQPTPVFLPGKFHVQRSLVDCSPWGHKESDMTEQPSTHCAHLGSP